MHRFKDLEIWKISRKFCTAIYVTESFRERDKFVITNQLRKAVVSVPSNTAEGASRKSNKDFSRFLEIAIGSCYELETQILSSNDLGYIGNENLQSLTHELNRII